MMLSRLPGYGRQRTLSHRGSKHSERGKSIKTSRVRRQSQHIHNNIYVHHVVVNQNQVGSSKGENVSNSQAQSRRMLSQTQPKEKARADPKKQIEEEFAKYEDLLGSQPPQSDKGKSHRIVQHLVVDHLLPEKYQMKRTPSHEAEQEQYDAISQGVKLGAILESKVVNTRGTNDKTVQPNVLDSRISEKKSEEPEQEQQLRQQTEDNKEGQDEQSSEYFSKELRQSELSRGSRESNTCPINIVHTVRFKGNERMAPEDAVLDLDSEEEHKINRSVDCQIYCQQQQHQGTKEMRNTLQPPSPTSPVRKRPVIEQSTVAVNLQPRPVIQQSSVAVNLQLKPVIQQSVVAVDVLTSPTRQVKNPIVQQSVVTVQIPPPNAPPQPTFTPEVPPQTMPVSQRPSTLKLQTAVFQEVYPSKAIRQAPQREQLSSQIDELRHMVKKLRLQKIKAKAEHTPKHNFTTINPGEKRYNLSPETVQLAAHPEINKGPVHFGRIKKNRGKSVGGVSNSNNLTHLINIDRLYINQAPASSSQTPQFQQPLYQTMQLKPVPLNPAPTQKQRLTSPIPSFQHSNVSGQSNKVTIRGEQICSKMMQKFQHDQTRFRKFMKRQGSRSRVNSLATQPRPTDSRTIQPFQQRLQSQRTEDFQGYITPNTGSRLKDFKVVERADQIIDPSKLQMINQLQGVQLVEKEQHFLETTMLQVGEPPNPYTDSEEVVERILPFVELVGQTYSESDLQNCILKKYKNCFMLEFPGRETFRAVWHYNGKFFIGGWNPLSNQKSGFGVQHIYGKYYYRGEFKDNKRNGRGVMVDSDGSIYDGQWVGNLKQGTGKHWNANEKSYYEGSWSKGKKEGEGHYESETSIYSGEFANDLKHGFGVECFRNGDKYWGDYQHGVMHGQGKYLWFSKAVYIGHFSQGNREGLGKWESGQQLSESYTGQFQDDKKQGSGRYVWANRCVYEGNFFNDLKHGMGTMSYPDGRAVEGIWTQGIITDVLSRIAEANKEQPLQQRRRRTIQTATRIRIREKV